MNEGPGPIRPAAAGCGTQHNCKGKAGRGGFVFCHWLVDGVNGVSGDLQMASKTKSDLKFESYCFNCYFEMASSHPKVDIQPFFKKIFGEQLLEMCSTCYFLL